VSSRIGSDQNFIATTSAGILDDQANSIVSSDTTFGSSPLGVAARTQALFGIANASFNLTPPDPTLPIVDNDNPLPYWTIENGTEGDGTAIAVFDDATSTWGVELSLGTATVDAAISMTTRSFLLNDDNLALRQKALSVLSKSGTAGGTAAQWNLVLSAEYFSEAGASLSSYAIGTVTDVTTWTSISGTTTAGGSAISSSAAYVDLTFTMTALGTVTGSAKATIKSLLLQTSTPAAGGGNSFLVTETFTSSDTWTRPTGVDYLVAVAGYSAGNGGQGGKGKISRQGDSGGLGGGGQPGAYGLLRDLYVGDVATVSVGIGAGGAGGAGGTATKAVSVTTATIQTAGADGGVGGNTTFGSYLVCATTASAAVTAQSGTVTTTLPFPDKVVTSTARTTTATTDVSNSTLTTSGFTALPFQESFALSGTNGANGTADGATVGGKITARGGVRTEGGTAGQAGIGLCMGGVSSDTRIDSSGGFAYSGSALPTGTATYYAGSAVQTAGGGGGAGVFWISTTAGTGISAAGGNGGNASANSGSGGGGGGPALWGNNATTAAGTTAYTNSSGTATGGNGGDGGSGYLIVAYIG
jgi:hypothetical protein